MADFVPREGQADITDWIARHKRCGVWAMMGLGKTGSTLFALEALNLVEDVYPALVLAPLRVANSTWPNETQKFDNFRHLRVSAIAARRNPKTSATAADRAARVETPADIYTLPYGNLTWLVEYLGDEWPFRTIVADEVTRLKSFRLQQGGANARALGKRAFRSERFIGLTGTPSPNGVKDLWGQTWFIDKGHRLGKSFSAFSMRWFVTGYDGFSIKPKETAQAEIEGLLADVCRTIEGPPVDGAIVAPIYVDLPPKARELYRQMEKTAFAEIAEMGVEAPNAAVKVNKLLQIASGNIYHEDGWEPVHDAKLEALESIVEEANGAPVLVQYNYQADLERILKHFRTARHLDADPKTEDRWNRGEIPILVAHGASAGHGLNLQDGGHILARYSYSWNFEEYAQILERIGPLRQKQSGYNRRVYDYPILARGTFDEAVFERHGEKCSVQDMLLSAMRRKEEK